MKHYFIVYYVSDTPYPNFYAGLKWLYFVLSLFRNNMSNRCNQLTDAFGCNLVKLVVQLRFFDERYVLIKKIMNMPIISRVDCRTELCIGWTAWAPGLEHMKLYCISKRLVSCPATNLVYIIKIECILLKFNASY